MNGIARLVLLAMSVFFLPLSADNLYTVGQDGTGVACYWITDTSDLSSVQIFLPNGMDGFASGVAVSSTNVYMTGGDGNSFAALWIAGLGTGATVNEIQLAPDSYALGVALSSTHVYVIGQNINEMPTLWITDPTGTLLSLTELPVLSSSAYAYGVAVSDSQVFITGYDGDTPILWITDLDGGSPKEVELPLPGSGSGQGNAVTFDSKQVYIAGSYYTIPSPFPYLWITDLEGNYVNATEFAINYLATGIGLSSTNVYISSNNNMAESPMVWITDLMGDISNQYALPSGVFASGLVVSPTNLYVVGTDSNNLAGLWIAGLNAIPPAGIIDLPCYINSGALGVALSQPSISANQEGFPLFKQITPNNPGRGLW